jgi:ABC-2 type transport system permease protein
VENKTQAEEPIMYLSLLRIWSVAHKELRHIRRDPQTLFFIVFMPVMELFMLGYAIDTNVRHVRTVVMDQAGTQESRALLREFENSQTFLIVKTVYANEELQHAIVAGEALVGIVIPADYSKQLEAGRTAQVQILVDGSVSSIAGEALATSNSIALKGSLERALGDKPLPIEARPRVLFNPDTRSANFFIPGLMVVLCQMMCTVLSATALVKEKESGTLEQLYMTPVRRGELILGKTAPYALLTLLEFCFIATLMRYAFFVPITGVFLTLLALAVPFALAMVGLGLLISTRAQTRDAAGQMAMGTILPAVFLSGYVFPLDSMPRFFQWFANVIPTTWLIDAARGVILRGAGWPELWLHAVVLWGMAIVILAVSAAKVRKQVG